MHTSGIYIHIPFCIKKCIYCDFYSVADQNERIDAFIDALVMEIIQHNTDVSNWKFDTIFVGGGTPSLLTANQFEKIISTLNKKYDLSDIVEFTMELNPGEAPRDKLIDFYSLGINRLSIGIQSLNSDLLKFLTRIHTSNEAIKTFEFAREAGFDNINCDLIYNIPNQTLNDWKLDLNQLIELNPEHISAYSLTVEKDTVLYNLVMNNAIKMPKDEKHLLFNSAALEILGKNNFIQYEISNYSKPSKECLHNLHYWENDTYLGFGPSAHSFDGDKRWNNYSNLDKYISLITSNKSPIEIYDVITEIDRINEIVGFGLRMTKGFDVKQIPQNIKNIFDKQLAQARIKFPGMIVKKDNRIRLNQKGIQFADAIAVELFLT